MEAARAAAARPGCAARWPRVNSSHMVVGLALALWVLCCAVPIVCSPSYALAVVSCPSCACLLRRVECVNGCECQETLIDALWQEKASMLMTAEFQARRHSDRRGGRSDAQRWCL